jgi:hypothetical protein
MAFIYKEMALESQFRRVEMSDWLVAASLPGGL